MIVTALVDNSRLNDRPDLATERGLSLHIQTKDKQLLFDTGNGQAFCSNAKLLNIDIDNVDAVAISHHHHDHCNGLRHFIKQNATAPVYLRASGDMSFQFRAYGFRKDISIDRTLFEEAQTQLCLVNIATEILPNVFLITDITQNYAQPKGNEYLYACSEQECSHDTFEHELMMVIREEDGIVVFTGCAHNGVLNMVDTAISLFPGARIKAVIGGFHLVGLPFFNSVGGSKKDIRLLGKQLLAYPIDKFFTGHCTGKKAFALLKEVLGEKLEHLPTGRSVSV
ncbi:MBL fold metallo-hydrolase [Photobacterium sp. DNB22_13_2]